MYVVCVCVLCVVYVHVRVAFTRAPWRAPFTLTSLAKGESYQQGKGCAITSDVN